LHVSYGETELREAVKAAGGFWNPDRKAWVLAWAEAMALGLEHRIIFGSKGF